MSLERIVEYYNMRDLSGEEIQALTGKQPILYSDLKNYSSIEQVLGKEKYVVLLYQTSSYTTGHFVSLSMGDNGKVRYFDSYGIRGPLQEIQYTPFEQKLPPYLNNLLEKVDYESNGVDYQSKKHGISTCGRWSSLACRLRNVPLQRIEQMIRGNRGSFFNDSDNVATILTLFALNNIEKYLEEYV
jgi:hypothetical protein